MFERNYYATHPDMMECVSNEELRDRYLIQGLFREGEVVLNYTHAERFVIGGVQVGASDVRLPDQTEPASAAGPPVPRAARAGDRQCRQKRPARSTVDGEQFELASKDCLYVPMGAKEVIFSRARARASTSPPAPRIRRSQRASSRSPRPMRWSAAASRNRTSGPSTSWSSPACATARSW